VERTRSGGGPDSESSRCADDPDELLQKTSLLATITPMMAVKELEILLRRLIDNKIKIAIVHRQSGHIRADSGHIGKC
jgi:hypothetical protein